MNIVQKCIFILPFLFLLACSNSSNEKAKKNNTEKKSKPVSQSNDSPKKSPRNLFLFMGDSLTVGYNLNKEEAFPSLIGKYWQEKKIPFRSKIVGASGYTSISILSNLNWYLTDEVHTVFLCIGGNDGLRGFNLSQTRKNIISIIKKCKKKSIRVILAGIKLPPNRGKKYCAKFESMYLEIAQEMKLKLMPFLLKDVAGIPKYNLGDGIHPNAQGHEIVAKNILHFFSQEKIYE